MNANSGTMTANASPARCPNECGPMWHVTWKEAALTAEADAERAFDRIAKLERENARKDALLRECRGHLRGHKMSMLAYTTERLIAAIDAALKEQNKC